MIRTSLVGRRHAHFGFATWPVECMVTVAMHYAFISQHIILQAFTPQTEVAQTIASMVNSCNMDDSLGNMDNILGKAKHILQFAATDGEKLTGTVATSLETAGQLLEVLKDVRNPGRKT